MRWLAVIAALAVPLAAEEPQAQAQAQRSPAPAVQMVAQPAAPAPASGQTPQAGPSAQIPMASPLVQADSFAASSPAFPRPAYFKHHFTTPKTRVELRPPVRLGDFVQSGKLEMSLRDYLELVLANNTDIEISRLNLEMPKNAIERAFAVFDPSFIGRFTAAREKNPATRSLEGGDIVNQLAQSANFSYVQMLPTGTQMNVGFIGGKNSTSDVFATFNPSISTSMAFGMSQPLLRNRGGYVTRLPISIARSNQRKSEYDFRNELIRIIAEAENAFWDVIEARENLRVQEEYFKLADEFLKRSEKELSLGAISQLDIYQPQQRYATAEIQVSRYKYLLAQREDALRRYIGADLDMNVRKLPIVLTETIMPPAGEVEIDVDAAVKRAMANRPDLKSALQSLDIDELRIKSAANMLRPDLSLTLGYTTKGRGGTYYEREGFGDNSVIKRIVPGGLGDAMDQLFGFGVPRYEFGLNLRLPIRDRRASSDMADAVVNKKLDTLRIRSSEQRVRLEVLNGVNQLESAKAGVILAQKAVDFAQKQVEAEQKKYDLGTNVAYFVMQAQADLVQAQSELVRNVVSYRRSRVNLLRNTGELLEERGVIVP